MKKKRETCVCCKNPLRLDTRRMTVPNGTVPETYKNDRDWPQWNGRRVLKVTSRRASYGSDDLREKFQNVDCWMGEYQGYGSSADRLPPLFCTMRCALSFAQKAYREGFDIPQSKID